MSDSGTHLETDKISQASDDTRQDDKNSDKAYKESKYVESMDNIFIHISQCIVFFLLIQLFLCFHPFLRVFELFERAYIKPFSCECFSEKFLIAHDIADELAGFDFTSIFLFSFFE